MSSVTLYHVPPSFYSQVGRLVLAEKGVVYAGKLAAAGPPTFETYAPWYMRLNPHGTVPVLVHGDIVVPDSREILAYVDGTFEGPALTPTDAEERARMEEMVADMYGVSIGELTYGSERMAKIGARINAWRARHLRRLAARHADLRVIYEAKLRDIEGFSAHAQDADHVDTVRAAVNAKLDALDAGVGGRPFLVGASYSLADLVWTVAVARFHMIGLDPLAGRPELTRWYQRMRERPSFAEAGVWERAQPKALLGMFARKLGPYLLGITLGVALLIWALW